MKSLKYVVTRKREVIQFPKSVEHSTFKDLQPVSAGFVSITVSLSGDMQFKCYGESLSLGGLKSRGDSDERLFELSGEV